MKIVDELQENVIYFLIGFMLALVLTLVVNPLLVMVIGFLMIGGKEIIERYYLSHFGQDAEKPEEENDEEKDDE
jgi:mannose/fructose/N-acetylgalactosamine-specific phosphotransferase system component IIC